MNFNLSDEQRMWQTAVHNFCEAELKPRAAQTDAEGALPLDVVKKNGCIGLIVATCARG